MEQSASTKKDSNNINNKSVLNSELLFFKNEILGDLKQLENKLLKKIELKNDSSQKKILQIETNLDSLTKKIFNLSNFFSDNVTLKERLDNLYQSRTKMEDTMNLHDYKITSIAKDLVTAINKYDKIIEKSIYYPGIIGANNAKFITFHHFVDYVLGNISQLNLFKDKTMGIDLKQYKNRLEATIEGFKKQTEEIITNNKVYTSKLIKNLDNKFKGDFELYDQRLFNLKIKNTEQVTELEKFSKNLLNELKDINDLKKNIEKSYETSLNILRWHYIYTENKMNQCVKDYDEIKIRIDLLIEAMKGLKGENMTNIADILKQLSAINEKKENPKKIKAESLLKKYIVGQLDMEQISQLSKKNSNKVTFNDKNLVNNIFGNDINKNNSGNIKKFSRLNTKSFVKFDSNHNLLFQKINQDSDNKKNNNINIFKSQRVVTPNKFQELGSSLSSSNINKLHSFSSKDEKINNSLDIRKSIKRSETLNFNSNKISSFGENMDEINLRKQILDLKNTKNIFNEKLTLSILGNQQNSSLWKKPNELNLPKNNIYNNKLVSTIKESQSEYKHENTVEKKEKSDSNEEIKEEAKEKEEDKENKKEIEKYNNKDKNYILKSSRESDNKKLNEVKNITLNGNKSSIDNINNNNNNSSYLTDKIENNKINDLMKSCKAVKNEKKKKKDELKDEVSNLDHQTVLSTITENNIITPRGEDEAEKTDKKPITKDQEVQYIKENLEVKNLKNEEIQKELENIFVDKENNSNLKLLNFEINSRNENMTNITKVHFPSQRTFQNNNKDNNFYLEIKNTNLNNTNNNINKEKAKDAFSINSGSKLGLHKLLKGDRNALNSFKLITTNVEDIKMPMISNSEYEKNKGYINNYNNIKSTKPTTNKNIKSNSSINFFNSNNKSYKLNNDYKFEIFENMFENNLEDLDYFNKYIENTDINLHSYENNSNKNKKSNVHIVHIPSIPQTQSQRTGNNGYSKDAFIRIEALRKIKNNNNNLNSTNNRKKNKSNENILDKKKFAKLKLNNKLMRTYEGFNM